MKKIFLFGLAFLLSLNAYAKDDATKQALSKELVRMSPSIKITELEKIDGLDMYQAVLSSGEVIYTNKNAKFILFGNLLDMRSKEIKNITEIKSSQIKIDRLKSVPNSDTINYAAKGKKRGTLYVFTDISCPYCQRMHEEIPELTKQGVEVKYLAFPRAGLKGDTYEKMHDIWCSDDRHKALEAGYKNRKVSKAKTFCKSIVNEQFELGRQIGVTGTPAVYTQDGKQIGGYAKADRVLTALGLEKR